MTDEEPKKPLVLFLLPGSSHSYHSYQSQSNLLSASLPTHGLPVELYTLDFLEQPTAYSGQMLLLQSHYLQKVVYSILNKHDEGTEFQIIAFDSGISVAYYAASTLEFPLSQMQAIISVSTGLPSDLA